MYKCVIRRIKTSKYFFALKFLFILIFSNPSVTLTVRKFKNLMFHSFLVSWSLWILCEKWKFHLNVLHNAKNHKVNSFRNRPRQKLTHLKLLSHFPHRRIRLEMEKLASEETLLSQRAVRRPMTRVVAVIHVWEETRASRRRNRNRKHVKFRDFRQKSAVDRSQG